MKNINNYQEIIASLSKLRFINADQKVKDEIMRNARNSTYLPKFTFAKYTFVLLIVFLAIVTKTSQQAGNAIKNIPVVNKVLTGLNLTNSSVPKNTEPKEVKLNLEPIEENKGANGNNTTPTPTQSQKANANNNHEDQIEPTHSQHNPHTRNNRVLEINPPANENASRNNNPNDPTLTPSPTPTPILEIDLNTPIIESQIEVLDKVKISL